MRDRERERGRGRDRETQAEGEAGSMQGARHWTGSGVSRIRSWAEGGAKSLSHPGCPSPSILKQIPDIISLVDMSVCGSNR